jgi:hypothetical protein
MYDAMLTETVTITGGLNAVMPNLYHREAPGASPDDAMAAARAQGVTRFRTSGSSAKSRVLPGICAD